MHVVTLNRYPLKSATAVEVDRATVTRRGLEHDRRWMLIDPSGEFLTSRSTPTLLLVRAEVTSDGLRCVSSDRTLEVPYPSGDGQPVRIWGQDTFGRDAGDEAAAWFSSYLETECRLVYQQDADRRPVKARARTLDDDIVSFADSYPVLLIGTASLGELNRRIGRKLSMDRFRPNIVVETTTPFEEDRWTSIRIGECTFANAKPCPRCVLTTIDPATAQKDPDGEPLRTLSRFRRDLDEKHTWFGTNIVPRQLGEVRRGDVVVVEGIEDSVLRFPEDGAAAKT
ncbi:MAG: MOSC N-terminal beta barrel domain-containing protein [Myxococcota bacterium]